MSDASPTDASNPPAVPVPPVLPDAAGIHVLETRRIFGQTPAEFSRENGQRDPCPGLGWSRRFPTIGDAYDHCSNPVWMLQGLARVGFGLVDDGQRVLRRFACACLRRAIANDGRSVWSFLIDRRSRDAVATVERYAGYEADHADLDLAATLARSALFVGLGVRDRVERERLRSAALAAAAATEPSAAVAALRTVVLTAAVMDATAGKDPKSYWSGNWSTAGVQLAALLRDVCGDSRRLTARA